MRHDTCLKEIEIQNIKDDVVELKTDLKDLHNILTKIYYAMLAGLGAIVMLLFGVIANIVFKGVV